jgi:hypothetical protein
MIADRSFAFTSTWNGTWTWTRALRIAALGLVGFIAGTTFGIAGF